MKHPTLNTVKETVQKITDLLHQIFLLQQEKMLSFLLVLLFPQLVLSLEYNFDTALWTYYPKEPMFGIQKLQNGDKRVIQFTSSQTTGSGCFYTYADLEAGKKYVLAFEYQIENIQNGNAPDSKCLIEMIGKDGKSKAGGYSMPMELKSGTFRREFTCSEGRARIIPFSLRDIAGSITINTLSITEVRDSATLYPASHPPVIDGLANDVCYATAVPIETFYIKGSDQLSRVKTAAKICYDKGSLYIAVRCDDPDVTQLKKNIKNDHGPIWSDDSIEVYIGTASGRKIVIMLSCIGKRFDGELYQRVPGDPYQVNGDWQGTWKGAAVLDDNGYGVEFSVPYGDLGEIPVDGKNWRINLVRNSCSTTPEQSQWNFHTYAHNNVDKFGSIRFSDDQAVVGRYREEYIKDPLNIIRTNSEFNRTPRQTSGRYIVCGMNGTYEFAFYSKKFQETNQTSWPTLQKQLLAEHARAGMHYPISFPWAIAKSGGQQNLETILAAYPDMKISMMLHNSSQDSEAILSNTARYFNGRAVNVADPALGQIMHQWVIGYLAQNPWIKPHLLYLRGYDEPVNSLYNSFSLIKNPSNSANLKALEVDIKKEYGYNQFGLFDNYADNSDPSACFRRISFMRWWNARFENAVQSDSELSKKMLPGVPFMPEVINTVSDFQGIEIIPQVARHADWLGVDPYPTATLAAYSRERALYHTGFAVKVACDLSDKRIFSFIQAFKYHGRVPSPDNLREWVSQALKNGAGIINYYSDGNLESCPDVYREAIRLSGILTSMKPLELPRRSGCGIFFSFLNAWGSFDAIQHGSYAIYTILGEQLKRYFKFISDYQPAGLGEFKLLFIPGLTFATPETARDVINYVKNGGTAVIFDPEALSYAPDGSKLDAQRLELIGVPLGTPVKHESILMNGKNLPLVQILNARRAGSIAAFQTEVPANARIIATYPDNTPAAFSRKIGSGQVIFFAAQPFGNSRLAIEPGNWVGFFAELMNEIKEPERPELWNFLIP